MCQAIGWSAQVQVGGLVTEGGVVADGEIEADFCSSGAEEQADNTSRQDGIQSLNTKQ